MTANVDAMVREAIKAYRAGNKSEARALLERATEIDQLHEQAWMWLSAVVDSVEDQRVCLENVLYINPDNKNAKRGLEILESKSEETPTPSSSEPTEAQPKLTSPFTTDDWEAPPTATSSASALHQPASDLSAEEYDEWVDGLNLGSDEPSEQADLSGEEFADVFADAFDDEAFDDDPFGGGATSTVTEAQAEEPDIRASFASETDEEFAEGPFSSSADFDEDLFEDEEEAEEEDVVGAPSSPVPEDSLDDVVPEQESPSPAVATAGSFYDSDMMDSVEEPDPGVYFRAIPKNIKATRLPGTKSSSATLVQLAVVVLAILNIGALGMLVLNLLN